MEMEGSGGIPLTQPPPAKDAGEAAATLALTKRARKRSRYLSPPYTYADVQEEGEDAAREEEEEEPPDVSAAAALSALLAVALCHEQGVDPAALRFLALHRRKNRTTATGTFDNHSGSRAAAAGSSHDGGSKKPTSPGGGGGGGVGHTKVNLSAGPAMPGPVDGSPALAKKKKNPNADGPMQDAAAPGHAQAAAAHIWASQSAGFAVNGTYRAANPAPPPERRRRKKYKKRAKSAEPEQQHFGPPSVVPSLQDLPPIARGAPPPPLPKLPLTDVRSNLEMMIESLSRRSPCSPEEAMPAMGNNLVGEMEGLLAKVNKELQGRSATAARHR